MYKISPNLLYTLAVAWFCVDFYSSAEVFKLELNQTNKGKILLLPLHTHLTKILGLKHTGQKTPVISLSKLASDFKIKDL